jgi:hypothetical protein
LAHYGAAHDRGISGFALLRHCALIKTIPDVWVNGFIYSLSIMKEIEVINNINNRLAAYIGLGRGYYDST